MRLDMGFMGSAPQVDVGSLWEAGDIPRVRTLSPKMGLVSSTYRNDIVADSGQAPCLVRH
jgi:hypothetical protein